VFELTVEAAFSAAHALVIQGEREPLHGHDWRVTAAVEGPELDQDGLLCDFHGVEGRLREITRTFHNRNLNDTPPFDDLNPSAEHVARWIADRLAPAVPDGARLSWLRVTEAPGCAATYRPPHPRNGAGGES